MNINNIENLENEENLENHEFMVDQTINDNRKIKGYILKNGIKVVLISDENINNSCCSVGVNAGYLQDEFEGTAHFLEHLLFMGSEKFPSQNDYHSYVSECGGMDNAFTGDKLTCYYLEIESKFLEKGIEMLSWFFRKPLLDMKHIESELEIINSEHDKNLLSDMWIIDDVFKKLLKDGKYTKFGTGNNESLKGITKEIIMNFYNKYYVTDNIFVCIIDSKPLDTMKEEYLKYFDEIEKRESINKNINNEKLNLEENNLLVFKSISKYNFLNLNLIIDCDETNNNEFHIINFINELIGLEFEKSLTYYLKEDDYIKNLHSSVDYYYDNEALLNIKLILNDDKTEIFDIVYDHTINYLDKLSKLKEDIFEKLYINYQKVKLLQVIYKEYTDTVNESIEVVSNMMRDKVNLAILRKYIVPKYDKTAYNLYKKMMNSIKIKIITNVNINNKNDKDYEETKWYKTKYYIGNYDKKELEKKNEYILENIIGIEHLSIKPIVINKKVDKKKLPELVFKEDNKEIYLLENNKYNKPICNISIVRKNINLLDKKNKVIMSVLMSIYHRILNYYIETMHNYNMSYNITISNEYIIQNFNGLNDYIDQFINKVTSYIHPDTIFLNEKIHKYFLEIKRDIIEACNNYKYNTPYKLCSSYLSFILNNKLKPTEEIEYLKKLDFDEFKKIAIECLKYSNEYYMIIGINKYHNEQINYNENDKYKYEDDTYIKNIIDRLSYGSKYINNSNKSNKLIIEKKDEQDYYIKEYEMNEQEINNCILQYYPVYNKTLDYLEDKDLEMGDLNKLMKQKITYLIISQLLNEPLFDKIRTIDKLGYIVKCDSKFTIINNNIRILIIYLVQSHFKIDRILDSFNNFNKEILEDIEKDEKKYEEKFNNIKESKLLELEKSFIDINEEVSTYIYTITEKIPIFNIKDCLYENCKEIKFSSVLKRLKKILNNDFKKYNIILDSTKNNKNNKND